MTPRNYKPLERTNNRKLTGRDKVNGQLQIFNELRSWKALQFAPSSFYIKLIWLDFCINIVILSEYACKMSVVKNLD